MNLRGHLSCWCCKIPWWTRGKMVSTKRMLRKPIMMNLVMMNHENPSIMMIILINRKSGNLVDIYVWSSMDDRCVFCCVLVPFSDAGWDVNWSPLRPKVEIINGVALEFPGDGVHPWGGFHSSGPVPSSHPVRSMGLSRSQKSSSVLLGCPNMTMDTPQIISNHY